MPAQKFNIVIAAVDQFSKVFQGLVKSVLSINQPIAQTNAQLKALQPGAGIQQVNQQVSTLGDTLKDTLGSVNRFTSTISGVAAAGGIAATLGSIIEFEADVARTARLLNTTTDLVQRQDTIMRQAGGSTGMAAQNLANFAANANLASRQAGPMRALFDFVGYKAKYAADGTLDYTDALLQWQRIFLKMKKEIGIDSAKQLLQDVGLGDYARIWLQPERMQAADRAIAEEQRIAAAAIAAGEVTVKGLSAFRGGVQTGGGSAWKALVTDPIDDLSGAFDSAVRNTNDFGDWLFGIKRAPRARPGIEGTSRGKSLVPSMGLDFAPREGETTDELMNRSDAEQRRATELAGMRERGAGRGSFLRDQLGSAGEVNVTIRMFGAPAGTVLETEQSGNVNAKTTFGHSMPQHGGM